MIYPDIQQNQKDCLVPYSLVYCTLPDLSPIRKSDHVPLVRSSSTSSPLSSQSYSLHHGHHGHTHLSKVSPDPPSSLSSTPFPFPLPASPPLAQTRVEDHCYCCDSVALLPLVLVLYRRKWISPGSAASKPPYEFESELDVDVEPGPFVAENEKLTTGAGAAAAALLNPFSNPTEMRDSIRRCSVRLCPFDYPRISFSHSFSNSNSNSIHPNDLFPKLKSLPHYS